MGLARKGEGGERLGWVIIAALDKANERRTINPPPPTLPFCPSSISFYLMQLSWCLVLSVFQREKPSLVETERVAVHWRNVLLRLTVYLGTVR